MKVIYAFFALTLLSNCDETPNKSIVLNALEQNVWIDSLCNEYHFKDNIISRKLLHEVNEMLEPIGKINCGDEIVLEFNEFENEGLAEKYYLKYKYDGKLTFTTLDTLFSNFMVLVKKDSIKKRKIDLLELHLKITPTSRYSSFLELTLLNNKRIIFKKGQRNLKLETATFSDSTFHQIEQYLEILEFNNYKDKYEYVGFDGSKFELKIRTNQYTKEIVSIQRAPEGLGNLISFIDYKLQIENGLSLH